MQRMLRIFWGGALYSFMKTIWKKSLRQSHGKGETKQNPAPTKILDSHLLHTGLYRLAEQLCSRKKKTRMKWG